jgi:hypothetical protein
MLPPRDRAQLQDLRFHSAPQLPTLPFRGRDYVWPGTERRQARETPVRRETTTPRTEPSRSNNPYAAAIEDRQNAMTVAFLYSPTRTSPAETTPTPAPDELGCVPTFGEDLGALLTFPGSGKGTK